MAAILSSLNSPLSRALGQYRVAALLGLGRSRYCRSPRYRRMRPRSCRWIRGVRVLLGSPGLPVLRGGVHSRRPRNYRRIRRVRVLPRSPGLPVLRGGVHSRRPRHHRGQ